MGLEEPHVAQHESLCPPTARPDASLASPRPGAGGEQPSAAPSLPPSLLLPLPSRAHLICFKKKKKVDSVPALLKPNMSVIDEAVFFNFKGEGAVSECGPGELKSPRRQETHGVTLPSGGAPPIPPLLVPCKGTDNAIFNKS